MSDNKRKKDYTRRPNTSKSYSTTTRYDDPDAPDGYRYEASFPEVFKDESLAFVKAYDVLFSHYLEARVCCCETECEDGCEPLLRYEHVGLYCDLYYAAERGERFGHLELAARRGIDQERLRTMLDRLEDCQLIIRVKAATGKGHPTHIVVCTPYEPGKHVPRPNAKGESDYLPGAIDAYLPQLYDRVRNKHTWTRRHGLGRAFPEVRWDDATMRAATKVPDLARNLHRVGVILADKLHNLRQTGTPLDQAKLMSDVRRQCREREKFTCTRKMFATAMFFQHLKDFAIQVIAG